MRILQVTSDLDGGGVDSILYNYCSRMSPRVVCDFVVTSTNVGILEEPLRALGSNIYHVAKMRGTLRQRQSQLRDILSRNRYDAVHDHSGYKSYFLLRLAQQKGINCRIAHAHIAFTPETVKGNIERSLLTPLTMSAATHLFACGSDAAVWMWGEKAVAKNRVRIMPNGIDTKKFRYCENERRIIRKQMGLDGQLVVGNVARLSEQKNHEFLIEAFASLLSKVPNAVLMLVGRGELEEKLKKQVDSLGINKSVMFLGIRDDVHKLLNAMDVFVLPSKYEGLPVTLVEVQANGLPVLVSDAVTEEIRIAQNYRSLPLNKGAAEWADCIISLMGSRTRDVDSVIKKYDIDVLAERQTEWYLTHEK